METKDLDSPSLDLVQIYRREVLYYKRKLAIATEALNKIAAGNLKAKEDGLEGPALMDTARGALYDLKKIEGEG